MSYWTDNYGRTYGPFSKQEDGFPNAGEVVRHYRLLMRLSQRALGLMLGKDRTWVNKMENENAVPQNVSRRRAIADLLKIPPILLGLGVLGSEGYLIPLEDARSHTSGVYNSYSIEEANEYLDTAWDAHRFTGSLSILPGVLRWKARIKEKVNDGGPEQERNLELLFRYEQLLMVLGSNTQDYTVADPQGLIDVARQLDKPDILGIALYQRSKMHFNQENHKEALVDIRETLSQVEHAGPQVKGAVLVVSRLAHYATDKSDVRRVLKDLDEAWKYVDPARGCPDPFHALFDESQYYLGRASSIIKLLRLDPMLVNEAFEALELADQRTSPHLVRRKAHIELLYADIAFSTGDYTSAVSTALSALELSRSVDLVRNIRNIQKIYNKLAQTKVRDSSELRNLKQALARK